MLLALISSIVIVDKLLVPAADIVCIGYLK